MDTALTFEFLFALVGVVGVVYTWVKSRHTDNNAVLSRLTQLETQQKADREALLREVQLLRSEVEKHNSIVERTYKMESNLGTAFKHIDQQRERIERLEDMKIGGTE